MDAFEILVVILSVFLGIFIGLAIVATVFLIKLLKKIDRAAGYVEETTSNIAAASSAIRDASGPAAIVHALTKLFHK